MILTIYENKKHYHPEYYGIYSITFDNGKRYIGLSNTICARLWEHLQEVKSNDSLPVHQAMKKHSYVFELIEDCKGLTRKEMCEREKYWISYY